MQKFIKICLLTVFSLLSLQLVAQDDLVKLGISTANIDGDNFLTFSFENKKDWHTYWKNPGDAGLAISINFQDLDKKTIELNSLEWPAPKRYLDGIDLISYGYSNEYAIFYPIPEKLKNQKLTIIMKWLVCKNICIPGKVEIDGQFDNFNFTPSSKGRELNWSKEKITEHFKKIPKAQELPEDLNIYLARSKDKRGLELHYNLINSDQKTLNSNYNLITPFLQPPMGYGHEQLFYNKNSEIYGKIPISWDGEYLDTPIELPVDGKFLTPFTLKFVFFNPTNKSPIIISKTFTDFSISSYPVLDEFYKKLTPVSTKGKESKKSSTSFLMYLLLAFIGGLILNVMPCVLPVISIKLFGLIKHQHASRSQLLKHNLAYSLGVIATFWVLALAVFLLKEGGEEIGWGFHLQSPNFVFVMILILFIMSLNFFGLFEFITPGGKVLGSVNTGKGLKRNFLSGVLATILSTPCSAPFLGTALTFAFTTTTLNIFMIFTMVGVGLSTPFLITGIFPKSIAFLPKPGMWMEYVRKFLGLTLLFTIVWLYDVLLSQSSSSLMVALLNSTIVLVFFAFYFHKHIKSKKYLQILFFAIPIITALSYLSLPHTKSSAESSSWESWSLEKMVEHKKAKDLVFIDFTAKWCLTCKINEQLILNTDEFKKLIKEKDIKLLLGDWTNRDPIIGEWLKAQGIVGVPAYFIQKKDGTLVNLGETITVNEIEENLN